MATPKQSSAQLPASAAAAGKKGRGVKEKHAAESAKTLTRKHVEAEQEIENPNTAAVISQIILEEIVEGATLQLYKRMLGRKCFSFAAYSTWRFVLSNVDLCYIRCDPGDPAEELQQGATEDQQHQRRTCQKTVQQQLQQGQEHRIKPQKHGQQREPQCEQHAQEEGSQQVQQERHQEHEQRSLQLQECYGQQQYQCAGTALWTCEEMPQLAPLDTWAPGSLTIKSISSSTIAVSTVKKGKKWGSSNLTGSNGHARSLRKGKRESK